MSKRLESSGDRGGFEPEFEADEGTGLQMLTYAKKVVDRLDRLGVARYDKPTISEDHVGVLPGLEKGEYFDGRLPTVIRKLTLDQLSALYSLFSNWFGYLQFQTGLISAERSEAKKQRDFLWSLIRQQKRFDSAGKKRTAQAMSDEARQDARFIEAEAKYEELNVLYECMLSSVKVADQDMKVISREVTIHQNKIMQEGVSRGMGYRGERIHRQYRGGTNAESQGEESEEPNAVPAKAGGGNKRIVFRIGGGRKT